MNDLVLTPYNKLPQPQLATVLLVGSEGLGKHDFGKCLIKNSWYYLQVRTTITLPLPTTGDQARPRIDYVCFMIDLTNRNRIDKKKQVNLNTVDLAEEQRNSLEAVEESLKYVDARYFLGKACFLALKVKNPEKRAIYIEQIVQLSKHYNCDVMYGSLETETESAFLAQQILKSVEISAGLQPNVSPLFLDTCKFI